MSTPATIGILRGVTPSVTIVSLISVLALAAVGAVRTEALESALMTARTAVTPVLESYFVILVSLSLALVIWLGIGRYKNIRLGDDDEQPEFSTFSWITMLFAAGMGVGLIFWSVAEPISHLQGTPFHTADSPGDARDVAMRLTFFHWGLHGWGLFALVAIVIGYFGFRHKLPLAMRSALYPLAGRKVFGALGDVMDTFTVVATVFGVVTTIGLGVQQLGAGLEAILGLAPSLPLQAGLTFALMAMATAALLVGLDSGLRLLSELNFWLSVLLVGIFFTAGPTTYLMALAVQTTGDYLNSIVYQSFWAAAHDETGWHGEWTVFYWGWWIAWAPFVGLFIARISRGRTLREFVMGVLIAPVIITFIWLAVLGGTGLYLETEQNAGIAEAAAEDVAAAFYQTIAALDPGLLGSMTAVLVTVLIAIYLITSASAGVLVINTLLAYGAQHHRPVHQVIWGGAIAVLAVVLLAAGGVEALQNAVVLASIPFSFSLILMMIGLVRALEEEVYGPKRGDRRCLPAEPWVHGRKS